MTSLYQFSRLPLLAALAGLCATSSAQDFGPAQPIAHPATSAEAVFTGDFDGDGDLDVVYGGGATIGWYENLGPAGFAAPVELSDSSGGLTSVSGGDLDGDGDLDLVAGGYETLDVLHNVGGGDFAATLELDLATETCVDVELVDLDGLAAGVPRGDRGVVPVPRGGPRVDPRDHPVERIEGDDSVVRRAGVGGRRGAGRPRG